jgi:hypothetical protein
MMEQLRKEYVAVFRASSSHGGIDDYEQKTKDCQLSGQLQHTECVEKSLHFCLSKHGNKLWRWGREHHSMKEVGVYDN